MARNKSYVRSIEALRSLVISVLVGADIIVKLLQRIVSAVREELQMLLVYWAHVQIVFGGRSISGIYEIIQALQTILESMEIGEIDEELEAAIVASSELLDNPNREDQTWADECTDCLDTDAVPVPQTSGVEEKDDQKRTGAA